MRKRGTAILPALRLCISRQLVGLAEKTSASAMLGSPALVVSHGVRLVSTPIGLPRSVRMEQPDRVENTIERRRAAAERMRGLFADVAPGRSLVDELIADRGAEAAAESRRRRPKPSETKAAAPHGYDL
jgi:hypothetical protein